MYIIEGKKPKKIQVQYEIFSNDIVQIYKRGGNGLQWASWNH